MWHHDALIYQVDPSLFLDFDGDGRGDLRGVESRLEHISAIGASTLWLLPFYRSPFRDGGYDVSDHLTIDPRFGDIADFVAMMERAESLGLRVLVELVMQHTSDQHPWFQEARSNRDSPYRDYYIWVDEPEPAEVKPIFPGVEDSIWAWDEQAGQFYRHTFYSHEPDLNLANPRVREEMYRIMAYWLRLGVAGFRVDAVPYMIERAKAADPREDGLWLLDDMHRFAWQRRPGAIMMGEADVEVKKYQEYFSDGDRLTHLLDFWTNNHFFLALARCRAKPLVEALLRNPTPTPRARRAVWLRNHDELDLEQLSKRDRNAVLEAFAPQEDMRIYGRGIRRRLAPMLEGDVRRLAMTHVLLISLPGTPILRYGDEIGMGDDLDLTERNSVRTAMQWSDTDNGGFSAADKLQVPIIRDGPFGFPKINVESQFWRKDSLLSIVRTANHRRLAIPTFGGDWRPARLDQDSVFGLRYEDSESGSDVITLVNLSPDPVEVRLQEEGVETMTDALSDAEYEPIVDGVVPINGYGYRWLRKPYS
jgi:maltose alpha-D-glucosyltransferase/alpha-amylase